MLSLNNFFEKKNRIKRAEPEMNETQSLAEHSPSQILHLQRHSNRR